MSTAAPLQNTAAKSLPVSKSSHAELLLQRKCACGGSASSSLSGECAECSKKKLLRKLSIGASNDPLEQEADRVADQVLAAPAHSAVSGATPSIQRFTGQATGVVGTAPPSVDRVLSGSGRPLDSALQQDMGQRFGHDFSQVRVHTGAAAERSARDVNAEAYTVGHNIVFGTGRFAPGTHDGRRLLAHELTHVAQQRGLASDSAWQLLASTQNDTIKREAIQESDASHEEFSGRSQKNHKVKISETHAHFISSAPASHGLLQRDQAKEGADPWAGFFHGGLIHHIRITMLLQDIYGDQQQAIADDVRKNPEAMKVVKESGVTGLVALVDTRRPNGAFDSAASRERAAHLSWTLLDARVARGKAQRPSADAGAKVAGAEKWAEAQIPKQGVLDVGKVVGLDPQKAKDLAQTRKLIAPLKPNAEAISAALTSIKPTIQPALDLLKDSKKYLDSEDKVNNMEGKVRLIDARVALDGISTQLTPVLSKANIEDAAFELNDARKELQALLAPNLKLGSEHVKPVIDLVTAFRKRLIDAMTGQDQLARSVERVDFVLRMFLFTNVAVSGETQGPSDSEMKDIGPLLTTTPDDDFKRVFATLGAQDYALFTVFGELLATQLRVRGKMNTAGVKPMGAVPSGADAEQYFTSMKAAPNDDVREAYTKYAQAFFYHRHVDSLAELGALTMEQIFSRDQTISGVRGIVCTGYALLGSALFGLSGAKTKGFIMAVRATDGQIKANRIDSGHALARVERKGSTMFVSNMYVVDTENDGIGPDAVAWRNKDNPLHTARGATLAAAHAALVAELTTIANQ